jgi:hypothetical protein
MKRYDDYEDHEILQMSEDDIEKLIEIECAVSGAPLKMEVPVAPEASTVEPDVTTYTVSIGTLRFAQKETALAAVDFLNGLPRLSQLSIIPHSYGQPYRVEPDTSPEVVGTERNWSAEHYARHAQAVGAHRRAKEEYDGAQRAYLDAQKKRESAVRAVRSYVEGIRAKEADRRHCRQTFASYLDLAEGNQDIALGFMLRTAERYDEAFIRETLNFPKETMAQPTEEAADDGTEQEEGRSAALDGCGADDTLEF